MNGEESQETRVRNRLRAYAREQATINQTISETGRTVTLPIGQRGEHGAKAFVALQRVIDRAGSFVDPEIGYIIMDEIERGLQ
jgi:hypothetical protein